jgi:hypothetical protein
MPKKNKRRETNAKWNNTNVFKRECALLQELGTQSHYILIAEVLGTCTYFLGALRHIMINGNGADHQNIIKYYEFYEDGHNLYGVGNP